MEQHIHTVKITGNLTFDSRFSNFKSAFNHFIADPNNEGLQLQVTDMINTDLPSMEIGVKISVSNVYNSSAPMRFAKPDAKVAQQKPVLRTNPTTGTDACFY
jgi:hypothetical protein